MKSAKAALEFLIKNYGVVTVTQDDCIAALSLQIDDFEDALVVVCAQNANADYIITRDADLLSAELTVKAIGPKDFIDMVIET